MPAHAHTARATHRLDILDAGSIRGLGSGRRCRGARPVLRAARELDRCGEERRALRASVELVEDFVGDESAGHDRLARYAALNIVMAYIVMVWIVMAPDSVVAALIESWPI